MAPTVATTGTQTASVGTEHTLYTQSAAHTSVMSVNLTNMVVGDTTVLTIYNKTLTGDTLTPGSTAPLYQATYSHARSEAAVQSVAVVVPYGAVFTLKQSAGTSRNYDWNVLFLD